MKKVKSHIRAGKVEEEQIDERIKELRSRFVIFKIYWGLYIVLYKAQRDVS